MAVKDILKLIEFKLKYRVELYRIAKHLKRMRDAAPTVLIAGAPRSGKTTLAKCLSDLAGYYHLDFDKFKPYIVLEISPEQRREVTERILRVLLSRFPKGLCIEGSLLVYGPNSPVIKGKRVHKKFFLKVASDPATTSEDKQTIMRSAVTNLKISEYHRIAEEFGAPFFAVGSTDSVQEKHEGLLRYRKSGKCWSLAGASDDEVYYLAMQNVYTFQRLDEICREKNICSLNIRSHDFVRDINQSANFILDRIHQCEHSRAGAAA